ncbi:ribosome-binding protein 1-like isoform X2 [Lethenteron reissneri]|uniref:ribosome-binding protein 1-like isoform X2 n=1 Tax=Lethenteron reissneri TaxID=7753 RepID=UPI002AB669B5|nr:ribosome-binding protein 1-like isoform X2 [Lethenteron reissneri]
MDTDSQTMALAYFLSFMVFSAVSISLVSAFSMRQKPYVGLTRRHSPSLTELKAGVGAGGGGVGGSGKQRRRKERRRNKRAEKRNGGRPVGEGRRSGSPTASEASDSSPSSSSSSSAGDLEDAVAFLGSRTANVINPAPINAVAVPQPGGRAAAKRQRAANSSANGTAAPAVAQGKKKKPNHGGKNKRGDSNASPDLPALAAVGGGGDGGGGTRFAGELPDSGRASAGSSVQAGKSPDSTKAAAAAKEAVGTGASAKKAAATARVTATNGATTPVAQAPAAKPSATGKASANHEMAKAVPKAKGPAAKDVSSSITATTTKAATYDVTKAPAVSAAPAPAKVPVPVSAEKANGEGRASAELGDATVGPQSGSPLNKRGRKQLQRQRQQEQQQQQLQEALIAPQLAQEAMATFSTSSSSSSSSSSKQLPSSSSSSSSPVPSSKSSSKSHSPQREVVTAVTAAAAPPAMPLAAPADGVAGKGASRPPLQEEEPVAPANEDEEVEEEASGLPGDNAGLGKRSRRRRKGKGRQDVGSDGIVADEENTDVCKSLFSAIKSAVALPDEETGNLVGILMHFIRAGISQDTLLEADQGMGLKAKMRENENLLVAEREATGEANKKIQLLCQALAGERARASACEQELVALRSRLQASSQEHAAEGQQLAVKFQQVSEEHGRAQEELTKLRQEVGILREALNGVTAQNDAKQAAEMARLHKECRRFMTEMSEKNSKMMALEAENESLRGSLSGLEQMQGRHKEVESALQRQLTEATEELRANKSHSGSIMVAWEQTGSELHSTKQRCLDLQSELKSVMSQLAGRTTESESLVAQLGDSHSLLDQSNVRLVAMDEAYKSQLAEVQAVCEGERGRAGELERERGELRSALSQAEMQKALWQMRLSEMEAASAVPSHNSDAIVEELCLERDSLKADLADLRTHNSMLENKISEMECLKAEIGIMGQRTQLLDDMTSELESLKSEVADIRREKEALEAQASRVSSLKSELSQTRSLVEAAESRLRDFSSLGLAPDALRAQRDELLAERERSRRLQRDAAAAAEEAQRWNARAGEAERRQRRLEEEAAAAAEERERQAAISAEELRAELGAAGGRVRELEAQLQAATVEADGLKTAAALRGELQGQVGGLQDALSEACQQNVVLSEKIRLLEEAEKVKRSDAAQAAVREKEAMRAEFETQLARLEERVAAAKQGDGAHEEIGKQQKLLEERQALQEQTAALQSDLDKQRQKNDTLRQRNWMAVEALSTTEKFYQDKAAKQQDFAAQLQAVQGDLQDLARRLLPSGSVVPGASHREILELVERRWSDLGSRHSCNSDELQSLNSRLRELEESHSSAQLECDRYKTVLADTEGILWRLQNSVEAEEKRWRERLCEAQREVHTLQEERLEVQGSMEALQKEKSNLAAQLIEERALRALSNTVERVKAIRAGSSSDDISQDSDYPSKNEVDPM